MAIAYLALGGNLGPVAQTFEAALRLLRAEPSAGIRILARSRNYRTPPEGGPPGQPHFLNAAVQLDTVLEPQDLLKLMLTVERRLGRARREHHGPRTIDLDLLFYGNRVFHSNNLTVPHPRLHERAFVLLPLSEIAADFVHPVLNRSVAELLRRVSGEGCVPVPFPAVGEPWMAGMRVLVTGSTSGIGRAIADAFAPAQVLRHGRELADLRDPAAVERLANHAWTGNWSDGEGLDLLVCNAGADTLTGELAAADFETKLQALLQVDLLGTMRLARILGQRMKTRGYGVILTVGWDQAETGMEGESGQLFAAAKGAIMNFTRSLAKSLAPEVRVNCLAPGWICTAWGEQASPLWHERVRRETPLGRWGLPEDVAAAAVWLASPQAAFITGQTIRVNGGAVM